MNLGPKDMKLTLRIPCTDGIFFETRDNGDLSA